MSGDRVWRVYVLLCSDGSYYVGHAEDLGQRVRAHNEGRGAAFTFKKRPVRLVWSEPHGTEREAIERERQLKRWSRAKKEALMAGDLTKLRELGKSREGRSPSMGQSGSHGKGRMID